MQGIFSYFQHSEQYDIDMLDSILCCAVQAVGQCALGIYKPAEARKQPDTTATRLASQLDMNSSIQLLKRAQRASTIGVNLVSSTSQSTPMSECMAPYSKMFNSSIPLSHNGSRQSSDSFSNTSHQHMIASSSTVTHT